MSRTEEVSTRDAVRALLDQGLTGAQIARALGISKSTVAYHRRRAGLPVDVRCNRRYDWTEVQRFHDQGHTARECMAKFGFSSKTWHDARHRGVLRTRPRAEPLEGFLVNGRRVSRGHLKERLVSAGLKAGICEECGISEWRGAPLSLALHHINGQGDDNRLENLQLLCPNCHSQTPNFAARNVGGFRLPLGAVWRRNLRVRRLPVRGTAT